ncbi:MAG: biopolymer transporter ExbD [Opitutales bacterium]|nr:biopolymer transporter ExbD [Opitutales bacterium]
MARSFHRKKPLDAMSEINMTPLIDLAFSLLIIFMITAPLLEQTIQVNLPVESTKAQELREDTDFQAISIDAEGFYYWDNEIVDLDQLDGLLMGLAEKADPPVIRIRADKQLPYQKVINVVDLVKKHKLTKLNLDTQAD